MFEALAAVRLNGLDASDDDGGTLVRAAIKVIEKGRRHCRAAACVREN